MRYTHDLRCWLSEQQWHEVRRLAALQGMSISTYIRVLIVQELAARAAQGNSNSVSHVRSRGV